MVWGLLLLYLCLIADGLRDYFGLFALGCVLGSNLRCFYLFVFAGVLLVLAMAGGFAVLFSGCVGLLVS